MKLTAILFISLLSCTGEFNSGAGFTTVLEDTLFIIGVGDSSLSPFVLKLDTDEPADRVASVRGLERFGSIFGLSTSSFRKLDFRRRVRSATDGGFSGKGGAGPLLPTEVGVVAALEFVVAIFWNFNTAIWFTLLWDYTSGIKQPKYFFPSNLRMWISVYISLL